MTVTLDDEYIDVPEAATRLGVSTATIWRWIDRGRLPAYRIGPRRVRLKVADVNNCITPVQPAAPRKVWMVTKSEAEARRPMSDEEREQMARMVDELRLLQKEILAKRGGVPFSITSEDLAEMREERLRQLTGDGE